MDDYQKQKNLLVSITNDLCIGYFFTCQIFGCAQQYINMEVMKKEREYANWCNAKVQLAIFLFEEEKNSVSANKLLFQCFSSRLHFESHYNFCHLLGLYVNLNILQCLCIGARKRKMCIWPSSIVLAACDVYRDELYFLKRMR